MNNTAAAIADRAIVVHAIDDDAVRFYKRFDFARSPNDDRTLMILMKDVRAMLGTKPRQPAQSRLEQLRKDCVKIV